MFWRFSPRWLVRPGIELNVPVYTYPRHACIIWKLLYWVEDNRRYSIVRWRQDYHLKFRKLEVRCHSSESQESRSKIHQSLRSYNLVYNGRFSNFGLPLLVRNSTYVVQVFCDLSYKVWSTVIAKIFNHWVICPYFGYICHYTPVALLLCCDNIKDWSIEIVSVWNLDQEFLHFKLFEGSLIKVIATIFRIFDSQFLPNKTSNRSYSFRISLNFFALFYFFSLF